MPEWSLEVESLIQEKSPRGPMCWVRNEICAKVAREEEKVYARLVSLLQSVPTR